MKIMTLAFAAAAVLAAPALAQDAAPAASTLPFCSAKVTDSCQQTAAQQARAMTGAQAEKRDAAHGGAWAPDARATAAGHAMPISEGSTHKVSTKTKKTTHHAPTHRATVVVVKPTGTTSTTTSTTPPQ